MCVCVCERYRAETLEWYWFVSSVDTRRSSHHGVCDSESRLFISAASASDWLVVTETGWGSPGRRHLPPARTSSRLHPTPWQHNDSSRLGDTSVQMCLGMPCTLGVHVVQQHLNNTQAGSLWFPLLGQRLNAKVWETQMLAQTRVFYYPPQQTVDNTYVQDRGIQTCQITILIHIIIVTLITWNVVLSIHILFWAFSLFYETCKIKK